MAGVDRGGVFREMGQEGQIQGNFVLLFESAIAFFHLSSKKFGMVGHQFPRGLMLTSSLSGYSMQAGLRTTGSGQTMEIFIERLMRKMFAR